MTKVELTRAELIAAMAKEAEITPGVAERALNAFVKIEKAALVPGDGEVILKYGKIKKGETLAVEGKGGGEELAVERACDKLVRGIYQIHEQVKAIMSDFERYQSKAKEIEEKMLRILGKSTRDWKMI